MQTLFKIIGYTGIGIVAMGIVAMLVGFMFYPVVGTVAGYVLVCGILATMIGVLPCGALLYVD